jgi:hypothetical protein
LNAFFKPRIYVGLVHHPVINKNGDVVASAVTNLDLHDIARAARTYGAGAFYVITPVEDQATLVDRILAHWIQGAGGRYNPKRRDALSLIRVSRTVREATEDIARENGTTPKTVATGAASRRGAVPFDTLRRDLRDGTPHLILLGTAWGLAEDVFAAADRILEPIAGTGDYNHLSVRSAAAIILDRLHRHSYQKSKTIGE